MKLDLRPFLKELILFVICMIILLLFAHGTKAQYYLAIKGAKVTFDTAVVISLETYRKENIKLDLADALIKQQGKEIEGLKELLVLKDSNLKLKDILLESTNNLLDQKNQTIDQLGKQTKDFVTSYKPPLNWWQRNKGYFTFAGGVAIGVLTNIR